MSLCVFGCSSTCSGSFHQHVGLDYVEKLVSPEVIARCRSMLGEFLPNEIEALAGEQIETLGRELADELLRGGIVIGAIQFKGFAFAGNSDSDRQIEVNSKEWLWLIHQNEEGSAS